MILFKSLILKKVAKIGFFLSNALGRHYVKRTKNAQLAEKVVSKGTLLLKNWLGGNGWQ